MFTIPVGVLVGTLIALSRMSADAEITAMRASGLSSRRLLRPVLGFALLAMMITGAMSTWMTPFSIRQTYKMLNRLIAAQLTAEIQPRVFAEQFPDTILYVGGVVPGPVVRWRNVFLADISPPDKRKKTGSGQTGDGPRITTASEAIAVPEVERNRIQLSLVNGSTHEIGQDTRSTSAPRSRNASRCSEPAKRNESQAATSLYSDGHGTAMRARRKCLEARVELHKRLVLPPACLLLALIGVPLGLSSRKGGKVLGIRADGDRRVPLLHGPGHVDRAGAPANAAGGDRDVAAERNPAGCWACSWSRGWSGPAIGTSLVASGNALMSVYWLRFAETCLRRHRLLGPDAADRPADHRPLCSRRASSFISVCCSSASC